MIISFFLALAPPPLNTRLRRLGLPAAHERARAAAGQGHRAAARIGQRPRQVPPHPLKNFF